MTSSSTWSAILFLSALFTIASCQRCGGIIKAGAGVIRSPNYPDGYPASNCVWFIHSDAETHTRIKLKDPDCRGDFLRIYKGNGTSGSSLVGEFCNTTPETLTVSSGRFITITFTSSRGARNKHGFVISYESIDKYIGSRVIWSEVNPSTGEARLNSAPAELMKLLISSSSDDMYKSYYSSNASNWTALATHYGQHELMWSSGLHHPWAIFKGSMGRNRSSDIFYEVTSSNVLGVAVDWLTGNVYWTDATNDWIIMCNANGTRHALIIDDDLDIPTGIAVHPSRGYLFWTDSGSRPKLERSDLAGRSRIELVTTNIIRPFGITIDYESELLYWVDSDPSNNRIEVSDLDGTPRRTLVHYRSDLGLYDLTISKVFIYATAQDTPKLFMHFKDSGKQLRDFDLSYTPYSIVTYGPDVQLQEFSPCSSNPCSYLCIGRGQNGYTCLCRSGFLLKADGHTCEKDYFSCNFGYLYTSHGLYRCDIISDTWGKVSGYGDNGRAPSNARCDGFFITTALNSQNQAIFQLPNLNLIDHSGSLSFDYKFFNPGASTLTISVCGRLLRDLTLRSSGNWENITGIRIYCNGQRPTVQFIAVWGHTTGRIGVDNINIVSTPPPTITCENGMPDIANAEGTPNPGDDGQVDIGDTGTYECDENFAPSGNGEINCTNVDGVGEWSETDFSCTELSIASNCNPDLQFIETPQNLEPTAGDLVYPKCRVNDEEMTVTWHKDGQKLDLGRINGIVVDQFNDLYIPHFDSRHEGHYACVVFAGDDTECLRAEANLTLNRLNFFSHLPVDAYIDMEIDSSVTFMCSPTDETWDIVWEKDGEPLEDPFTINGNLVLRDIGEEDKGKYTCVVRDPWSRSTGRADAWLFLSDPPQIDISAVCGTITSVLDNTDPISTPDLSSSEEWSSFASMGQPNDDDINEAEARSSRIVGGAIAEIGSAPYMVQISEFIDREWTNICGGTLLDQQWVLTAAHCMFEEDTHIPIQKENMRLLFGEHDTLVREDSELLRRPVAIIVHEEYNGRIFDNDIALIRIEPPIREFTTSIRPICLAPYTLSSRLMKSSVLGRVTGWGQQVHQGPVSRFLREVVVPFVDRQTCQESVDDGQGEFTENMFCAGYHTVEKDACGGDSGGPLAVRYDDGRWYQLGIVSWGIGCAEEGEYGFYTHVSRFLHWLRSKNVTVAYSSEVGVRFSNSHGSGVLAFTIRSPSNLTVTTGSTVDLECVPNRDDASVEWFIGNSPEPVNMLVNGVRILPTGLVFHFDAIPEEFAGAYSCVARVDDGEGEQVIRADFQIQVTPA